MELQLNNIFELMKSSGISEADIEKFQDEIDDADHDIESIKEDISDREQSMLLDFFRDECDGGETIFDVIQTIFRTGQSHPITLPLPEPTLRIFRTNPLGPIDIDIEPPSITHEAQSIHQPKAGSPSIPIIKMSSNFTYRYGLIIDYWYRLCGKHNIELNIHGIIIAYFNADWTFQYDDQPTLDASFIIIPDIMITNAIYLEDIRSITYVLNYNNACVSPPRLRYSYIEFWYNWLAEETPRFSDIADDIEHNEGPTFDYLMEHPPYDRILPVLEKIVMQLRHPILLTTHPRYEIPREGDIFDKDIDNFFWCEAPDYRHRISNSKRLNLMKTCILFKNHLKNKKKSKQVNWCELFTNFMDIYDRILYDDTNGVHDIHHITGYENKKTHNSNHFAAKLNANDRCVLNNTLLSFRAANENNFFVRLEKNPTMKINDNVRDYQLISLSFILFIKAFICNSGNGLEKKYHILNAPSSNRINVQSLKQTLKIGNVDDRNIDFCNDNFPLQFDLCIISKNILNDKYYNDYDLDGKYDDFTIESSTFIPPTDRNSVYTLYGQMVHIFRNYVLNPVGKNNKNIHKDKIPDRYRYCIVIDQNKNKLYMYPPHFKQGYYHRKKFDSTKHEYKNEYNDLTNFYLTSKCIIPSKTVNDKYYGVSEINGFVLSAHFHKQEQNIYRYPKLRMYQYFNGKAMRFFYKNKHKMNNYKYDKDIINLWPKYFTQSNNGIDEKIIDDCDIFDDVLDLYKCDLQYFQWDNAIKRHIMNL